MLVMVVMMLMMVKIDFHNKNMWNGLNISTQQFGDGGCKFQARNFWKMYGKCPIFFKRNLYIIWNRICSLKLSEFFIIRDKVTIIEVVFRWILSSCLLLHDQGASERPHRTEEITMEKRRCGW